MAKKQLYFSIIIPVRKSTKYLNKCLKSIKNQDYPNKLIEVIIVSLEPLKIKKIDSIPIKIIHDTNANCAEARNIASKNAKGDILAFIDDDCIAPPNWLSKAEKYFKNSDVVVVGGSSIPPHKAPLLQKYTGIIVSSFFGTASMRSRYKQLKSQPRKCDETELILANMFVRKKVFKKIKGFDIKQVPCEENELNNRIKKAGYTLLYVPDLVVEHRMRPLFLPFFKRVYFYAIGRGIMSCRFPETLKILYLVPSIFVLGIFLGIFTSIFNQFMRILFIFMLSLYFLVLLIGGIKECLNKKDIRLLFIFIIGIFFHHVSYGLGFLRGVYSYLRGTWGAQKI